MNETTIAKELAYLRADLKNGDEIISEFTVRGKEIKHSKKVGDARIKFMGMIRDAFGLGEITTKQATEYTNEFGRKTTTLYWIK